jgi:hypothetical protein
LQIISQIDIIDIPFELLDVIQHIPDNTRVLKTGFTHQILGEILQRAKIMKVGRAIDIMEYPTENPKTMVVGLVMEKSFSVYSKFLYMAMDETYYLRKASSLTFDVFKHFELGVIKHLKQWKLSCSW